MEVPHHDSTLVGVPQTTMGFPACPACMVRHCAAVHGWCGIFPGPWVHTHDYEATTVLQWGENTLPEMDVREGNFLYLDGIDPEANNAPELTSYPEENQKSF